MNRPVTTPFFIRPALVPMERVLEGPEWQWLSTADTAAALSVTQRTVYRMIDNGQLAAYRIGRLVRVRRCDLEAYLEAARIQPGDFTDRTG